MFSRPFQKERVTRAVSRVSPFNTGPSFVGTQHVELEPDRFWSWKRVNSTVITANIVSKRNAARPELPQTGDRVEAVVFPKEQCKAGEALMSPSGHAKKKST